MNSNIYTYPPYLYLAQVAEHCPKAVSTYLSLWKTMSKDNKLAVYKKDVRTEFLTSLAKFRHDLLLLVKEGLISIDETPNVIHVEVVDWQIDAAGHTLC